MYCRFHALYCSVLTGEEPLGGHTVNKPLLLLFDPSFKLPEEHFTFHLQYKHSGTLANRQCARTFLPSKSENVRLFSSNSIENATPLIVVNPVVKMPPPPPSSGTSPLAPYKKVSPRGFDRFLATM